MENQLEKKVAGFRGLGFRGLGFRGLGFRVRRPWGACWMVAEGGEGENPLPFSLTAPKRGGGGGVGGVSRLRFPPGPYLRSSRFSRHPRLRQAPTRRFAKNRNLRGLGGFVGKRPQAAGGPGPKPWGPGPQAPWRPGPQAPGARHSSQRLTSCKPSFCCVSNPWVRVSKP